VRTARPIRMLLVIVSSFERSPLKLRWILA
jgi:hypothetical protein